MKISVVIPTFNRKDTLRQGLLALSVQDYPDYEVLVVDGGKDGTQQMMAVEFPTFRYLFEAKSGPSAARNLGIQEATGEIIAFTDDDTIAPPNWLSMLADGYKRYPQVSGVAGRCEPPESAIQNNVFARHEAWGTRYAYGLTPDRAEYLGEGLDVPGSTSNVSYRREVLLAVGGFSDKFTAHIAGEERELRDRICAKGYNEFLYVPIKVDHLRGYSFSGLLTQALETAMGVNRHHQRRQLSPTTALPEKERLERGRFAGWGEAVTMGDWLLLLVLITDKIAYLIGRLLSEKTTLALITFISKLGKKYNMTPTDIPPQYVPMLQNIMELEIATLIAKFAKGHSKILNVGPSWGRDYYTLTQAGHQVINLDVAYQQHLPNLTTADLAQGTPFADKTFDAVIIAEVLEHIWNDFGAVQEARRILKDNGKLIITVPFYNDDPDYHVRLHSPKITQRLLRANGFTPIDYIERGGLVSFPRVVHGIRKVLNLVGLGQAWNEWVIALDEQLGRHPTPFLRLSPGHGGFFVSIKGQSVDFEGLNVEAFRH